MNNIMAIQSYSNGREGRLMAEALQDLLTYEQGYTDGAKEGIEAYISKTAGKREQEIRTSRVAARAAGQKDMLDEVNAYFEICHQGGWIPTAIGFESFLKLKPQREKWELRREQNNDK